MKKSIIIIIGFLILCLSGCETKHLSINQSEKNFLSYQTSMENALKSYGYELREVNDENEDGQMTNKNYSINVGEKSKIDIYLSNSAYNSETGVESFLVEYLIGNNENITETFDTELFIELVNAISGKKITKEFCDEFLTSPESKYPASNFGFEKLNNEKVAKQKPLNFFEDWVIFYTLDAENNEILSFGGLTKQLED